MKKKTKSVPRVIQSRSFADVLADLQAKGKESLEFVQRTGLCPQCRKNPAGPGPTSQCSPCQAELERLLKPLRGPGFLELRVPIE